MKKIFEKLEKITLIQWAFIIAYGLLVAGWAVYYAGYLCGVLSAVLAGYSG